MIKIKTEKVVVRGLKKYKILELVCLEESSLPISYIKKGECCYLSMRDRIITNTTSIHSPLLVLNGQYTEADMDARLSFLRRCGERLREINKQIAEETRDWHGEETLII